MCIQFIPYNYWEYKRCFDVMNVSFNWVSTIVGLASCIIFRAAWQHQLIIEVSVAFLSKNGCDNSATMSETWAAMERQRLTALHLGTSKGCAVMLTHDRTIGRLSWQSWLRQHCCYVLYMSINGVSTILGLASGIIKGSRTTSIQNRTISRHSGQKSFWWQPHYAPKLSVTRASMILRLASSKIMGLCDDIYP